MSVDNARELGRVWLETARNSLRVAQLAYGGGLYADAVFNTQQAAEKALKAYLLFHTREFPFTHNLLHLRNLCQALDSSFGSLELEVATLNNYYMETRYAQTIITLQSYTEPIAAEAIRLARNVLAVVEPLMI
jgi:HEPN domain-containing protein